MPEQRRFRLGGIWSRTTSGGMEVISGGVTTARLEDAVREAHTWGANLLQFVVFQNTYKRGAKEPDYVVYLEPQRPQPARSDATVGSLEG